MTAAVFARCGQNETRAETEPPPIEIRATVAPAQAATVSAQIDGRVEVVHVSPGAAVQANAPLAQLTNAVVERDAAVTGAQLQMIEARLRRASRPVRTAPTRPSDTLDLSEKILELRRQRFEKMKALRSTNDVTAQDLQQAEVEYLAALRDYNYERRAAAGVSQSPADDLELLRIEQQKTAAEQKFAAHRQSLLRIDAPFAGTVTRVHVTPGQTVGPREPIADVADVRTLVVRGGVAPELVRYLRPGMRVDVKVLSVPVRMFADEIDAIVPAGGDATTPTVVVTIPNPDHSLQPNTEALITLRTIR